MISQWHHPDLQVAVLAAGQGKRMRSRLPKVLHPVLGRAMIDYVLHTVEELRPRGIALVTGHGSDQVRQHVGQPANLEWVIQDQQLGTGHAVKQSEQVIKDVRDVLIVCGDTPLLSSETLAELVKVHGECDAVVTVLTANLADPFGYGRIIRGSDGRITEIIEERDATTAQREIAEVSSGIYCVRREVLFELLHKLGNRNAQGEYYLPDIVPLALAAGHNVESVCMADPTEIRGINNRAQLAEVEACMQRRIILDWQLNGVTVEQPETVRIESTVQIGMDSVIRAGSQLLGATRIGDEAHVGPYATLNNAWVDDGAEVFAFSHVQDASIGAGAKVGPFSRLRPGAELDEKVHIGNFVEIKKSVVGRSSKINHLSYIGDTMLGEDCNIGAGTITCNYDGANKHQTTMGDRVFVGSDTKLIAPVSVASDATIGAGSIITRDVASGGLTLSARPDQRHVPNWQRPSKKTG
ncbi:MAG TPA: bifunctional UDP-N-acetylglucosamine diphosphorylase/glucosamine-1-phosphate N-acetyltransferase GlmU [Mariprofundaceae bacterium]|nr:bifunctional UDP-N-acetylglucosamine diphosphorylase/glucosamine-1-phosphate N-acetyltransferase GlmU [Mariprofundaceae bacterium]